MWLLKTEVLEAINSAMARGFTPTDQQSDGFNASLSASATDTSRVMTTAGGKAQINVTGVLTNAPNIYARFFGGGNTTYTELRAALLAADADSAVNEIQMSIDSPGGGVDGLFEFIDTMRAVTKPIRATATRAASAAYAIAAQADSIEAAGRAATFGSIGIVAEGYVSENRVSVTSTNAPKKRPDLKTEQGRAVVREELDALHDLFVEAIAAGRDTSADNINANYGQGAILLAGDALKKGMIDSIKTTQSKPATTSGKREEARSMDLAELKSKHPQTYAAAVAEGQAEERDRATAHLVMGAASGDMETAVQAVKDGSAMTATIQATYLAAGMNKNDSNARQDDDDDASALDGVPPSNPDADAQAADAVMKAAAEACGVEWEQ